VRAGLLRHRVDIMLPSTTEGTRGQRTGAATTVASGVPCSIETLAGRELYLARQIVKRATLTVSMRHPTTTPTAEHYLQFGTRQLHIGHVDNVDQKGRHFVLTCSELS
jgi:SPP1 family predicted phage head-tail adaptor